ncbi:MAG: DUF3267 domain-containing protein [Chloroflexota bacterium]|nr:MAG: DUF3267 domain-containing protein [Chloroflexota bacterium]
MRFRYGPIPEDVLFQPEAEGWSGIREPGPLVLNISAIPVAVLLILATIYAISLVWEGGIQAIIQDVLEQSGPDPFLVSLAVLVISIPVHELVHLFTHPRLGRSNKSILGFWLSRGVFYAHYEGVISRDRFLTILISPYMVLVWIPVIILAVVGASIPLVFVQILVLVALVNSALPAGDIVGFFLLVSQVPSAACVKNRGWKSYWVQGAPCDA